MCAHQRKSRGRVVENRRSPRNCVVAGGAIGGGEGASCRGVIGVGRLLPSCQVAPGIAAVRGRNAKAVIVIDVAGSAGRNFAAVRNQRVRVRQRETECVVVEFSVRPFGDGVACGASRRRGWEIGFDVIWDAAAERRRAVPRGEVTAHAVRRVQRIIVAYMAGRTRRGGRRSVRARQGEACRGVIKRSAIPAFRGVAIRAVCHCKSGSGR